MFGKVYAQVTNKRKTFEKIALVSGFQPDTDRTALYLQETNKPLIVVGNTSIEGKSYLPVRGIRSGTISGVSFYGNELIHGSILKSKPTLPSLPKTLHEHLSLLQNLPLPVHDERYIDFTPNKTYTNSFTAPTKTIFSTNELVLRNVKIIGNILIRSDKKITVASSTTLKDVILIAPEIEIEANTKSTFQAIASEQILVGKDCQLDYPSSLVIKVSDDVENASNEIKQHIFIDQNTKIKGIICYLQNKNKANLEPQIMLKEHALLEGFLFCEQQLELLGNVHGSVYTKGFITKQFGAIYQNHIYNGEISNTALMEEFVDFPLENLDTKVMKWLY